MTTQVVDAVFEEGVFRPLTPLALADNVRVRIVISQEAVVEGSTEPVRSLFGSLPQLSALADIDILAIKDLWRSSLDKQIRILHDGE